MAFIGHGLESSQNQVTFRRNHALVQRREKQIASTSCTCILCFQWSAHGGDNTRQRILTCVAAILCCRVVDYRVMISNIFSRCHEDNILNLKSSLESRSSLAARPSRAATFVIMSTGYT